jgi:hypothetical protein
MSTGLGAATVDLQPGTQPGTHQRDYTAAIYGSLLVTTLVALQSRLGADVEFIALSLVASVVVFWLTHMWSSIMSQRVHGPIAWSDMVAIGADESPMLAAAVIPAALLSLAKVGLYSVETAVDAALVVSLAQLFLWGLLVGRRAHSSWPISIAFALVDFLLGVAIAALKLTALH